MTRLAQIPRGAVMAALLCLPIVFLFAQLPPPTAAPECLSAVTIARGMHFEHVCDSYGMAHAMNDLPSFFTVPNNLSARIVYIVGGEGLAMIFRPLALLVRAWLVEGYVSGRNFAADVFLALFPEYFAMFVMNVLVLAASLRMAMRLFDPPDRLLAAALGAAIATSDLVHGLFWTQHPNFMNIIVPLGCITYFMAGCRAREMSTAALAGFGLAAAVMILAYGYAVIWLPAFVFGALYRDLRMRAQPAEEALPLLRIVVVLAITACGPVFAWWAINKLYLHGITNYEAVALRQFLWIADAWHDGRLGTAVAEKARGYLPLVWGWLGWPAPVALVALAGFAVLGRTRLVPVQTILDPILIAVMVTVASMLAFNFLQGYFQPRLVNGLTLALFVAAARVAQRAGLAQIGALFLIAVAAAQVLGSFLAPSISLT